MSDPRIEAVPVCYRHPDRPTWLACSECNRPICPQCSLDAAVGQRCPECVQRQGRQRVVAARELTQPGFSTTPVTLGIVAVTGVLFVLGFLSGGLAELLVERLAMFNPAVAAGEVWRMVTVVLLHGSPFHLLFNMWALYVFGPPVEREVGPAPFLSLYLASAAVGSAFAFFLGGPFDLGVGASGAIFGLFGMWLNGAYRKRRTAYGRYMLNQLGFLLLINAALPFIVRNISWQAHLGGLVAGFLLAEAWSRMRRGRVAALRAASALLVLAVAMATVWLV